MILMALIAAIALALVIVVILLALTAPPPERKDLLDAIEAMRFDAAERAERYAEAYWEQAEEAERKHM